MFRYFRPAPVIPSRTDFFLSFACIRGIFFYCNLGKKYYDPGEVCRDSEESFHYSGKGFYNLGENFLDSGKSFYNFGKRFNDLGE